MDFRNLIGRWICCIGLLPFIISVEAYLGNPDPGTPGGDKIYAKLCSVKLKTPDDTSYDPNDPYNYDPNDPYNYDPNDPNNYDPNDPNNYDPNDPNNYDPNDPYNYDPNDPNYNDTNNNYQNNPYPNNGYPNNGYPNDGYPNNGYPNNQNYYADEPVYPIYYDSNVGLFPPTPDYETDNCTDIFPVSGECMEANSTNFIYWNFPTAACYLYEDLDCQGSGDSGTNDFFTNTGQSPAFLGNPPKSYESFVCYSKFPSESVNLY